MAADVQQQVRRVDEFAQRVLGEPEIFLAVVVDDAVMVLEIELARGAVESLDEVIEGMWMLQRIDSRKAVHPKALDSELAESEQVLQAHPGRAAEFRPARGVTGSHNDLFHD